MIAVLTICMIVREIRYARTYVQFQRWFAVDVKSEYSFNLRSGQIIEFLFNLWERRLMHDHPEDHAPEKAMGSAEPPQDFDRLREEFQHRYEGLSPHLQRIAHFALGDPNRFALQTVAETARETDVQPSTVIRFAKEFGFSGFSEMQRVFRLRLIEGASSFRDQIHEHRGKLEEAAADDPSAILNGFADASVLALQHLKADIDSDALRQAVRMMDEAKSIYVIGQRRAFPVVAYLSYGLIRLEYRCHLLDSVGGMLPQQVATIGLDDLLIAVSFAEYAQQVVDVVSDAHIRKVPVLAITDSMASPLARSSSLYFEVRDAEVHRFRPLAAPIVLAQSLIIALGYYRDARIAIGTANMQNSARTQAVN